MTDSKEAPETLDAVLAEIELNIRAYDENWQPDSEIPDSGIQWREWYLRLTAARERERAEQREKIEAIARCLPRLREFMRSQGHRPVQSGEMFRECCPACYSIWELDEAAKRLREIASFEVEK